MSANWRYGHKRASVKRFIQKALDDAGLTQRSLAERIGLSPTAVNNTINGLSHSPRVLEALRQAGVPEKYLFDPRRPITPASPVSERLAVPAAPVLAADPLGPAASPASGSPHPSLHCKEHD